MGSKDSTALRNVDILAREVRSRRVNSKQLRELLDSLAPFVSHFSNFTVSQFGKDEDLEYPFDRVHEAIDAYDVRRITGTGYRPGDRTEPFIKIDLNAGLKSLNKSWLFQLHGPAAEVENVERIIRDTIKGWQATGHHWYHNRALNATIVGITFTSCVILIAQFLFVPSVSNGVRAAVSACLSVSLWLTASRVDKLAPFICFNRGNSPVESPRK